MNQFSKPQVTIDMDEYTYLKTFEKLAAGDVRQAALTRALKLSIMAIANGTHSHIVPGLTAVLYKHTGVVIRVPGSMERLGMLKEDDMTVEIQDIPKTD